MSLPSHRRSVHITSPVPTITNTQCAHSLTCPYHHTYTHTVCTQPHLSLLSHSVHTTSPVYHTHSVHTTSPVYHTHSVHTTSPITHTVCTQPHLSLPSHSVNTTLPITHSVYTTSPVYHTHSVYTTSPVPTITHTHTPCAHSLTCPYYHTV